MTTQRTYYCNLCSSSGELIGLHWTHDGIEERHAASVEHHICNACLGALKPIVDGHTALDAVERFLDAHPPEPELRLPEGWTHTASIVPCGERAGWWQVVVRNESHRIQVDIAAPDKPTAIRAAQAAVDELCKGA